MCGILNVVSKSGKPLNPSVCRRALSKLSWRGPDYITSEMRNEGRLFLGQSILSITGNIEDSRGAHLRSASGRYRLNYNGEIYNYHELETELCRLKGSTYSNEFNSDSQVLIDLHDFYDIGDIPTKLDGMYAYSVWDETEQKLSFTRDLGGEKSIYFYEDDAVIIASSSISAILTFKPDLRIDRQLLKDYFRTRHFMFFERTLYDSVVQIPPGCTRQLDLETFDWHEVDTQSIGSLISPERMDELSRRSDDQLVDELDDLLSRNLEQMIPDRTFASVVSGGIDSSLISRYTTKYGDPKILVAVDHIGKDYISQDLKGFEDVLKQDIHVIRLDLTSYAAEIERCQNSLGSPLLSHSFVGQSIQSSYVQAKGCRVLFGGDGADELFGGYACYLTQRQMNTIYNPSFYTGHNEPEITFLSDDASTIQRDLSNAWKHSLDAYQFMDDPEERLVQSMMYGDFAYQLSSVGLRGTDFMSMMWSVETRSVFLRRGIIEFGLNLPVRMKVDPTHANPLMRSKPILKSVFLKHFPEELLVAKQGFAGFPNESRKFLSDLEDFLGIDYLDIDRSSIAHRPLSREAEWKLINIEYFLRQAGIELLES